MEKLVYDYELTDLMNNTEEMLNIIIPLDISSFVIITACISYRPIENCRWVLYKKQEI